MRSIGSVLLVIAACGDNHRCEPEPGALPASGDFIDPYAMALPADCIVGGLQHLPGRWFISDQTQIFAFSYPLFEGSCETGFRQKFGPEDDHDPTGDPSVTRYTWCDGTRLFERFEYRFGPEPEPVYTYVQARVLCVMPDDTIAAVTITDDNASDPKMSRATGIRFGRKDELAKGIELVGALETTPDGEPIEALNLVLDGKYAYISALTGFEIVDVSNPAVPAHVAHFDGNYNDVKVVHGAGGKTAAFLSPRDDERTFIADVTDPAAPRIASLIDEFSHSLFVQTRGATTELYLATYEDYVPKYDITDPFAPVRIGMARVPGPEGGVHDLFVDGDQLYVNNTTAGFVALDVTGGLGAAKEMGRTDAPYSHASWAGTVGGRRIMLHGDEGMTKSPAGGAYLRVLDGDTSPQFMTDIGRYQTRPEVGIHNFEVHGDRAYIAYYQDGLRIVDLSDPTQPKEVAHYNTWDPETAPGGAFEGALGVRVVGDLIYVADDVRGLLIFRETP